MHRFLPLLLALAAGVSVSCQSMSEGVFALEARATVLDDQSTDIEDVDVSTYGAQLALNTPIFDILGAVDFREYGDGDTPELSVGVRRRFLELWRVHPFIEGNLRYGLDLDTGTVSDDYVGYNLGGGVIFDLTDHIFLTARLLYENAELSTGSGDVTADGWVGMLGVGIHF